MTDTAVDDIVVPIEPVFYEAPVEAGPAVTVAPPVEERIAPPPPSPVPLPGAPAPTPLRERRWQTWHVVAAAAIAVVLGLVVGRVMTSSSGGPSSRAVGTSATGSDVSSGSAAQPAAGSRRQRSPENGTATTVTSAPDAAVNGHAVLLGVPRQTGPMITQHFTVTGSRWTLGWAYDCTAAPGGTGAFNVKVFDGSGNESNDGGINQQGAKGSSVVAYTSTGERYLWVTTNCVWAVRVTS